MVLLVEGKSKLEPLPALDKKETSPVKEVKKANQSEDSADKERNDLKEVDEKLEKFTAGIKISNKPQLAPAAKSKIQSYEEEKSEYINTNQ